MIWTSLFFLFFGGAFGFLAGAFCKERQFQDEWIHRYQECLHLRAELLAEMDRVVRERRKYENGNGKTDQ